MIQAENHSWPESPVSESVRSRHLTITFSPTVNILTSFTLLHSIYSSSDQSWKQTREKTWVDFLNQLFISLISSSEFPSFNRFTNEQELSSHDYLICNRFTFRFSRTLTGLTHKQFSFPLWCEGLNNSTPPFHVQHVCCSRWTLSHMRCISANQILRHLYTLRSTVFLPCSEIASLSNITQLILCERRSVVKSKAQIIRNCPHLFNYRYCVA